MAKRNGNQLKIVARTVLGTLITVGGAAVTMVIAFAKTSVDHDNDQKKFNKLTSDIDATNYKIKEKSSGLGGFFNRNEINGLKNDLSNLTNERSGLFNKKK